MSKKLDTFVQTGLADYSQLRASFHQRRRNIKPRDGKVDAELIKMKKGLEVLHLSDKQGIECSTDSDTDDSLASGEGSEWIKVRRMDIVRLENHLEKVIAKRSIGLENASSDVERKLQEKVKCLEHEVKWLQRNKNEKLEALVHEKVAERLGWMEKPQTKAVASSNSQVRILQEHIQQQDALLQQSKKMITEALDERDAAAKIAEDAVFWCQQLDLTIDQYRIERNTMSK